MPKAKPRLHPRLISLDNAMEEFMREYKQKTAMRKYYEFYRPEKIVPPRESTREKIKTWLALAFIVTVTMYFWWNVIVWIGEGVSR